MSESALAQAEQSGGGNEYGYFLQYNFSDTILMKINQINDHVMVGIAIC